MARKYGGTGLGLAICPPPGGDDGRQDLGSKALRKREASFTSLWTWLLQRRKAVPILRSGGARQRCAAVWATAFPPASKHSLAWDFVFLLVEDNAVNRALAQRLLQKRDFTVSIATDGKQAISATQKEEFDLILMDIQMPEMDGFEATAEIRKREKLTGRRNPHHRPHGARPERRSRTLVSSAGMDAYVTKPIRPAELFTAIQNILQSSAAGDAPTLLTPVPSSG